MKNISVFGAGNWGTNLVRVFHELPACNLHSVVDTDRERLAKLKDKYHDIVLYDDPEKVYDDPAIDAVVIATPACSHYDIALRAIEKWKHILVEKPLACSSDHCNDLVETALKKGLILMVGHTFRYNPVVQEVKTLIDAGELGDIYYIYSTRLSLGRIRRDVSALWNFAPHDISIITYWLGENPCSVSANGHTYLQKGIEDVFFLTLYFSSGRAAHIHVSWLNPRKERRITLVGSKKMAIYDDVNPEALLTIYDRGVTQHKNTTVGVADYAEFQMMLRTGDILIPKINFTEPLKIEAQHFVDCIEKNTTPTTDGRNGMEVVNIIEAAEKSHTQKGVIIDIG